MDVPGHVSQTVQCQACRQVVDLSGLEPFTQVRCPYCDVLMVVPVEFGNYLLFSVLGVGGMGTVYKALDLTLQRTVALKVLKPKLAADPEFIASFSREASAAAAVSHVNVCQVFSFGDQQGHYYIAMELLEQNSLDDRILQEKKLDEPSVLSIGVQVAQGLRAAFRSGLLHRDVKPGNVLFNAEGLPKIVDFGLARPSDAAADPNSGPIWGTPYYIAPEKLLNHGDDIRSDIYSLGATLFHALAGRPPFEAATATDVAVKHTTQPVTSLKTFAPGVQDQTAQAIGRMLAKNPAERYQDYDLLIADLETALANLKALQSVKAIVVTETGERISLKSVISTVSVLAVGLLAILLVFVFRDRLFTGGNQSNRGNDPVGNSAPAETDVNFTTALPIGRLWQSAADEAALGHTDKALEQYAKIRQTIPNYPRHLEWLNLYQGLVLLADGRPEPAQLAFAQATNATIRVENYAAVTSMALVSPLARALLGQGSLEQMQADARQMPSWAEGVVHLVAGFEQLQKGQLQRAADSLQNHARTVTNKQRQWMLALQPLAAKLVPELRAVVPAMEQSRQLETTNPQAALQVIQASLAKTQHKAIQAALQRREAELKAKLAK